MRLLPFLAVTLTLVAGCRETARCNEGQHYDPSARACRLGVPSDAGSDAGVDASPDAGPPCDGECALDHCVENRCLSCIDASECDDPAQPICGPGGECTPCETSDQCVDADATRPNCSLGRCERCDAANEATLCEFTCDIRSGACTSVPPGTRRICETCGSNLQCQAGLECVPMMFGAAMRESAYCLPRLGASECAAPYLALIEDRRNVSGDAPADYCGPNELLSTCEAVAALDASRACPGGDVDLCLAEGSICGSVGAAPDRCTYRCTTSDECFTGQVCGGDPRRCGGS